MEQIARDSVELHWPIMEVLSAYLREHARAGRDVVESTDTNRPPADHQAIATVIGRRRVEQDPDEQYLHLTETHLSGVDWFKAHLKGARLDGSHLERANLIAADLEMAWLNGAHLEGPGSAWPTSNRRPSRSRIWKGRTWAMRTWSLRSSPARTWRGRRKLTIEQLLAAQGSTDVSGLPAELASRLFERILAIREHVLGSDHPETAPSLGHLADLLLRTAS